MVFTFKNTTTNYGLKSNKKKALLSVKVSKINIALEFLYKLDIKRLNKVIMQTAFFHTIFYSAVLFLIGAYCAEQKTALYFEVKILFGSKLHCVCLFALF